MRWLKGGDAFRGGQNPPILRHALPSDHCVRFHVKNLIIGYIVA
jgi:hypothetical protein